MTWPTPHGEDWVASDCRFEKVSVLIVVLYLSDSLNFTGINVQKLGEVGALICRLNLPAVILVDWNMSLGELIETDWLKMNGLRVVTPLGVT